MLFLDVSYVSYYKKKKKKTETFSTNGWYLYLIKQVLFVLYLFLFLSKSEFFTCASRL